MKKLIYLLYLAILSTQVFAQDSGFGLGILVGEPTGFSAKLWTTENTALDAALAWSFAGDGFIRLHSDLLWHKHYFDVARGELPFYFGFGARLVFASDLELGIRIPVGLSYQFESGPFELFFELVPVFNLLPEAQLDLDAGLGVRYYF